LVGERGWGEWELFVKITIIAIRNYVAALLKLLFKK